MSGQESDVSHKPPKKIIRRQSRPEIEEFNQCQVALTIPTKGMRRFGFQLLASAQDPVRGPTHVTVAVCAWPMCSKGSSAHAMRVSLGFTAPAFRV